MICRILLIALAMAAVTQAPALASWEGQVIGVEFLSPDMMTVNAGAMAPNRACVGMGPESYLVEVPAGTPQLLSVDFSPGKVLMSNVHVQQVTFVPVAPFTGFRFQDVDGTIPDITGVTVDGAPTLGGFAFPPGNVTFDANNIWVNIDPLTVWFTTDTISLSVTFAGPAPAPAPECAAPMPMPTLPPAGLALLALALVALGVLALRARPSRMMGD